ncbi:MAG TPA: alpha-L-fucosidase [Kineosporiaceae bacterium]|nr:alpha-L-fucosidase [Kineosporiaceae bacterium]
MVAGSSLLATAAGAVLSPQEILSNLAELRFGMFNHFNMGTFTNEEWATPSRDPKLFAPTGVDCAQWAAAAAAAKMRYGVLTTKHHDGFCLWPSAQTSYTVANSSYQQDIVQQYVTAFRNAGLKVGLYFSIWDRTRPVQAYGGHVGDTTQAIQPADITYILNQLTELLTNYGTIDMLVTDGYAWQMGQQAVPYQRIREHVKSLQPNTVMIDIGGLSVPWSGDAIFFEEPLGVTAPAGNTYAGLQGQTISDGWFWHPSTPTAEPMSKASILSHLSDLETKWTSLILNCPPNRSGRLDDNIVARLTQVGAAWSPNLSRPGLPTQPLRCEHPVTPISAYATGWHSGEGPLRAIDGRTDVGFETCWSTWSPTPGQGALALPQSLTIDLGGVWSDITTLEYLPKQWNRNNTTDGDITAYTVFTSTDGVTFSKVAGGNWAGNGTVKIAQWPAVDARFVRLRADAATGNYSNVSDLRIGGRTTRPTLKATFPPPATQYRILNLNSGKALDVSATANGTPVIQTTVATTSTSQLWTFERDVSGYLKIRNVKSGRLLEIGGRSRANDATANLWADTNAAHQQWALTSIAAGTYLCLNRFSGLALNVNGASTADGAAINQYEYLTARQEQWQLVAVRTVAQSTTSATTDATTMAYGATARVQLRVTGAATTTDAKPSGTVTVLDGTRQIGTETLSVNGKGTATLTEDLPVGTHSLTVRYSGDENYGPSDTTLALTVTRAATTTALSLSKTSIGVGQDARADIEVNTETRATIAGTVIVTVSGPGTPTTTHTGTLDSKNRAKLTIGPFTTSGTLSVTATFPGSTDNQPSTSTSQAVIVTP